MRACVCVCVLTCAAICPPRAQTVSESGFTVLSTVCAPVALYYEYEYLAMTTTESVEVSEQLKYYLSSTEAPCCHVSSSRPGVTGSGFVKQTAS